MALRTLLGLLLSLLAVTAASAVASPEIDDLYALSKLKSSLLSRSDHKSTLLADWDITSSAGTAVPEGVREERPHRASTSVGASKLSTPY
jgi:hypothetical protein